MRTCVGWAILLTGAIGIAPSLTQARAETTSGRVATLVQQLGHPRFAKREEASKELDAIGEPALDALRKAAASSDDAEVRQRAERIVAAVTGRVRAAVTKKELEKLQGTWSLVSMKANGQQISGENRGFVFTFKGDRWSLHVNGLLSQAGTVQQIEVMAKHNAIDLPITEGGNVGVTAISIYAIEGDELKYVNSAVRATELDTKPGDYRSYSIFRRVKPGDAPPPEIIKPRKE